MPWVKNLCRLCGQIGEVCYDILKSESNYNLQQKIKKCLNLEICKEDFKPKEICGICCNKLNDLCVFLEVCYATDTKFETMYFAEPWHQNLSDRIVSDIPQKQQSVIVSSKQVYENLQTYSGHESSVMILQHYTLNTSNNINFSETCSGNLTQHNECSNFPNIDVKKQSCLLNESEPNDIIEYDNMLPQIKLKNTLSVDEVKNSIKSQEPIVDSNKRELNVSKWYSCPHCDKTFMRRSNLNAHIASHTKIRPFKCSICSKAFAVKCHLTQHKKIHSDEFQCRICYKNFDVPSKLSRHLRTHTNEKPYACSFPQCKKAFSDSNNLKYHSFTHLNDKHFSCDICMKLFKSKKNLRTHVKTHISNTKFSCVICQKTFKYKHNFKNHALKHNETHLKKN